MPHVLYVYAIGEQIDAGALEGVEGVDSGGAFETVEAGGLTAIASAVDAGRFSQEEIDRHTGDLEWLGAIGYRHETVVSRLASAFTVIPLRAFTLFSGRPALEKFLQDGADDLRGRLAKLAGRQEWTLRVDFDAPLWAQAIVRRVESLRKMSEEIDHVAKGRAFLLRKKLDEERKKASREAELEIVGEIESAMRAALPGVPLLTESRTQKSGSSPQLDVLIRPDQLPRLQSLHDGLQERYARDGIRFVLTGPWPPYSFASGGF